jgi:uncharacterized membrane protein YvlD (DUF360 family)
MTTIRRLRGWLTEPVTIGVQVFWYAFWGAVLLALLLVYFYD